MFLSEQVSPNSCLAMVHFAKLVFGDTFQGSRADPKAHPALPT
ncbi:MAG: hypothetical protein AAB316_14460 [Bacteroidota bacterium]